MHIHSFVLFFNSNGQLLHDKFHGADKRLNEFSTNFACSRPGSETLAPLNLQGTTQAQSQEEPQGPVTNKITNYISKLTQM